MKSPFEIAVAITLDHEKGYVNNPDDPGGETKYGISARAYPRLDIINLTAVDARTIYFMDYWSKPGFHRLGVIAPNLAIKLFDLGVNCGTQTAVKFLQRAVNVVCFGFVPAMRRSAWRQEMARLFNGKPLKVDGIIGDITLEVIRVCPHQPALMAALKGEAYKHYSGGDPVFVPGWLNRLEGGRSQ